MNNQLNNWAKDHIHEWLNGTLSEKDIDQFAKTLQTNESLQDLVKKERDLIAIFKYGLAEDLTVELTGLRNQKIREDRVRILWIVFSGIITFFLLIGILSPSIKNKYLYNKYYNSHLLELSVNKESISQDEWILAKKAYSDQEYQQALRYFEEIKVGAGRLWLRELYMAQCYLALGQTSQAITILKDNRPIIQWHLALAHLRNDGEVYTRNILKKLVASEDLVYTKKANELLNKLNTSDYFFMYW
jgi:hypothetical protein